MGGHPSRRVAFLLPLTVSCVVRCGSPRGQVDGSRAMTPNDAGGRQESGVADATSPPDAPRDCDPMIFGDPHVETELRSRLSDKSGPIPSNLPSITIAGAASLDGLECFTRLKSLELYRGSAASLGPLSKLTELEHLYVTGHPITDLSPLSSLTKLRDLTVTIAPLAAIAPIAGLTSLELLQLDETQVADLGPLSGLAKLRILSVAGTKVASVDPLAGSTALMQLTISRTLVTDLSPISFAPGKPGECPFIRAVDTPLGAHSQTVTIPALCALGWAVNWNVPGAPQNRCGGGCRI